MNTIKCFHNFLHIRRKTYHYTIICEAVPVYVYVTKVTIFPGPQMHIMISLEVCSSYCYCCCCCFIVSPGLKHLCNDENYDRKADKANILFFHHKPFNVTQILKPFPSQLLFVFHVFSFNIMDTIMTTSSD
mgnify:CR=1 FL=1